MLTKDYETVRIRLAFHPADEKFEVANPAIRKDAAWLEDIAEVFAPDSSVMELTDAYIEKNTGSPETAFDFDIRQVEARGLVEHAQTVIDSELPETFWTGLLPDSIRENCYTPPTRPAGLTPLG